MKQRYFIKFDPRINQITGCPRATLILSTLEYWFVKKPNGFYKFIEPCSHRLYKKGDSWAEELGCERRCFSRSFKKIGVKYTIRMAFEAASDKFQGKMYASYYDRYTNQMFFIRNHDFANKFLKDFSTTKVSPSKKVTLPSKPLFFVPDVPLSTVHNGLSYIEPKNTPNDLSKDKSHAGNEVVKKMIELWTALVEGGKGQIELTGKRTAFLKKALSDKFDNCLEKWKEYCERVASSRFLMGEIKPFRATLDWVLKFDVIQKILEGNYGVGDRSPLTAPSRTELQMKQSKIDFEAEEDNINNSSEDETIKSFRRRWLRLFGAKNFGEQIKNCAIEVSGEGVLTLRPAERYTARSITSYWNPAIFLEGSPFSRINIFHGEGDLNFDKWFESEDGRGETSKIQAHQAETIVQSCENENGMDIRDVVDQAEVNPVAMTEENSVRELAPKMITEPISQDVVVFDVNDGANAETKILRTKLRESIPLKLFPSWLIGIEVNNIDQDGILIVEFEDSLMVEWCRSRFSKEILRCAQEIWQSVSGLVVREKPINLVGASFEGTPFRPVIEEAMVNREERSLFEKAVQSLMDACSSARPLEAMG